jgi:hypothetical protein
MEEGRQHAPWLEVRGNHDNFDVKTRGGPQDRARAQFLCILTLLYRAQIGNKNTRNEIVPDLALC